MANSKLLKEAIADAKAVRETAIANAKIALEEAFTPRLQSILSRKLQAEMEGEETPLEGEDIEDFPKMLDQMSDEQFEELFDKAKSIFLGEGEGEEGEEKSEKSSKSLEDEMAEFEDLAPPDNLTSTASARTTMKKKAFIIPGRMESDGQYYVSCPNTNIKAMIVLNFITVPPV